MKRIAEPELMLVDEQAQAYALADFEEPHSRFVELLQDRLPWLPSAGRALDLGCGPGDITRRFCRAYTGWKVDAVDGSPTMLALGRQLTLEAGLTSRIEFHELMLPAERLPHDAYELVFSNSLLHHLGSPEVLWSSIRRWAQPGVGVFVMDLVRPAHQSAAQALVEQYAEGEPEILRRDFYNSLLAAHRPDEVQEQLQAVGLAQLQVEVVTDRHMIVWGEM